MTDAKGTLLRSADLPVEPGGPTLDTVKKWLKQQVVYKNYAGTSAELDRRAVSFVLTRRLQFRNRMSAPMQRWVANWSAANTEVQWQEHEDDIHIPETQKALNRKVNAIEEGILAFDPVFECEGVRGELSRRRAGVIGSYVYRQMELARWRDLVQPTAKDGELCNTMCIKVGYHHVIEDKVDRKVERRYSDGGKGEPYFHDERRLRKDVAQSGITLRQVDPFWLIYDLDAPNHWDGAYIGDESRVFLHELEERARQGLIPQEAVTRIRHKNPGRPNTGDGQISSQWVDQFRRSRNIALTADYAADVNDLHGARRVEDIELWAWFDFGEDGYEGVTGPDGKLLTGAHRVVIEIAAGEVMRFQLNPYDRKFAPYAFARINRTGHEMAAPAPFDSVVQANAHYDRWSSTVARWADLMPAPICLVNGPDTDLPETIQDIRPGSILKHTGEVEWIKPPDITNVVGYFHQFWRREMEENSGALRVFESNPDTATETERKVQEQQRAIRNSIRANAELYRQVAMLVCWISGQFATKTERFKVVGKAETVLGQWAEITPDLLQEDVDFRFLGLTDLHTFGNRQNGIRSVLGAWGPLLPSIPGINLPALFKMDFELSVGKSGTSEIFPQSDPAWEAWSQEEENIELLAGNSVPVHPRDNDQKHIEDLRVLLRRKDLPEFIRGLILEHLAAHLQQWQQKEAEQDAQQREADRNAKLLGAGGGAPGQDRPPAAGGIQPSNSVAQSPPNVRPGPEQSRTVARTGRQQRPSQQQTLSGAQ